MVETVIPLLFKANATDFVEGNSIGKFDQAISCEVTEELNGAFELHMTIIQNDPNLANVEIGSIILARPNQTSGNQAFVIEQIIKSIDGTVEIYATHIAQYRAKLIPVMPFTASSLANTLTAVISNSVESNPFTMSTDKTVATNFVLSEPRSMRDLMGGVEGSILDIYRGEYFYNNFDIYLYNRRGRDLNIKVLYGTNMIDYLQTDEFDWSQSVTGILPYYKKLENDTETVVVGDVQYSDYVDYYSYKKTIPYDFSMEFMETVPTVAQLNEKAQTMLNGKGLPTVSIDVSFEDLSTLPMFRSLYDNVENLQLGDTVNVINSQYNTNFKSRIRRLEFDVLMERYSTIQIGDEVATINDAISGVLAAENTNEFISYTAGTGIDITNNVISTDLVSGTGIDITGNEISNTGLEASLRRLDDTDLNSVLDSGTYYVVASSTTIATNCNFPNGTNGLLIVAMASTTVCRQFYFRVGTVDYNDHYWYSRQINTNSGTYGAWVGIYNYKNLSFGTGLDYTSGVLSNPFVYKAGDTVTITTPSTAPICMGGYIGSNGTALNLTFSFGRGISATSISATTLRISAYSSTARLIAASAANDLITGTVYSCTLTLNAETSTLTVHITKNDGTTFETNATSITGALSSGTFVFS